jgi:large subunit ribosomal protein L20
MPRVKRGTVRRANRKKLSKITKGFFLTKSKLYRSMKEAADKAGRYAFRDRRRKKRDFRRLWIIRISAAARSHGLTYSQLIHGLKAWPWKWTARCWRKWPSKISWLSRNWPAG